MASPRAAESVFLYGLNPVFESVLAGRRELRRVYLNAQHAERQRLQRLEEVVQARGIPLEHVDRGRLSQLCGTREHQGVVVEAGGFPYTAYAELLGGSRLLLLDNLEDPHNVGAILRSAEVFGFTGVLLPRRGCPGVLPSVVKASAGACEHLQIAINCSANQYVKIAMEAGYSIVALDGKGQRELAEVAAEAPARLLLVVGGEGKGVGQFILNAASAVVRIPQHGRVNSLNASVAAGIALFAFSELGAAASA